ncbi:MAG: ABC transporter substrate-binding protein [Anaerolineae bacterium]
MKVRTVALTGTLALGLLAAPVAAEAQKTGKVARIAFLSAGSQSRLSAPLLDALRQGLRDLGWVESRNLGIELRWAEGKRDRLPGLAAELVRLKVDVILTVGTSPTRAAQGATTTIPIVMVHVADPVGSGVVASLARPGGNITGVSSRREGFPGKWLELIKEMGPQLSRVAALLNPKDPPAVGFLRELRVAAKRLEVELHPLEVREEDELNAAFDALAAGGAGALIVFPSAFYDQSSTRRILDLVAKHRLPAIYPHRGFVRRGGLMSYAPSILDSFRRAATYVDKILNGAKPADLPVEQPTKFELIINLKTANALGLTIPPSLLFRADRVIK